MTSSPSPQRTVCQRSNERRSERDISFWRPGQVEKIELFFRFGDFLGCLGWFLNTIFGGFCDVWGCFFFFLCIDSKGLLRFPKVFWVMCL